MMTPLYFPQIEQKTIVRDLLQHLEVMSAGLSVQGDRQQFCPESFILDSEILMRQNRNVVAAMEKMQNAQNQDWQH